MRWPWRAEHQRRDREVWADLIDPDPATKRMSELAAQVQAETLREPTIILAREDWE